MQFWGQYNNLCHVATMFYTLHTSAEENIPNCIVGKRKKPNENFNIIKEPIRLHKHINTQYVVVRTYKCTYVRTYTHITYIYTYIPT